MDIFVLVIIMLACLVAFLILGLHLAFVTGGVGILFSLLVLGPGPSLGVILTTLSRMTSFLLIAIPLFIFMGIILQKSGIAEDLYKGLAAWLGPLRGGLAIGTLAICGIFAAMVGIAGAEVVTLGIIALPSMLKYKYDKSISAGTILAGGTLGQLIPPSILFIFYGSETGVSVGQLFAGGLPAGIILLSLFSIYVLVRVLIQKDLCPSIPPEERANFKEKIISLKALALPGLVIVSVLGTIFLGVATPSEAAAMGCLGALIAAAIQRRLNWTLLKEATVEAFRVNGMVMWVVVGASCFATVLNSIGGMQVLSGMFMGLQMGKMGIFVMMMLLIFVLGCFLDPVAIILITIPFYLPIVNNLGFDPLWFGIVYVVNLQMTYITPPFGYSIFYLKGVAPSDVSLGDIYRSVGPFVILEIIGLIIMTAWPQTVLWLPRLIFSK